MRTETRPDPAPSLAATLARHSSCDFEKRGDVRTWHCLCGAPLPNEPWTVVKPIWVAHVAMAQAEGLTPALDQPEAPGQPVVDATWALNAPDLWETPDARSIPTLLAAIGQVLAATEGREARLGQRLIYTAPPAVTEPRRVCEQPLEPQAGVDVAEVGAAARLLLRQIALDRRAPYWHDRARDLDGAQVWLGSVVDWSDTLAPSTPEETQ